jgi:hypothetical protein
VNGLLGVITPGARLMTPDGAARYAGLLLSVEHAPRILAQLARNDPLTGLPMVKAYPIDRVERKECADEQRPLR